LKGWLNMKCNFKTISLAGKVDHVYTLNVLCHRHKKFGHYYYTVEGQAYGNCTGLLISPKSAGGCDTETFDTPEEAFAFADKIAEKYPRYGDERDFDINLAPLYEGVEDKPIKKDSDAHEP